VLKNTICHIDTSIKHVDFSQGKAHNLKHNCRDSRRRWNIFHVRLSEQLTVILIQNWGYILGKEINDANVSRGYSTSRSPVTPTPKKV